MPRILIVEPYAEIRELLARVVAGLGLEPVLVEGQGATDLSEVGAVLLEPGAPGGVDLARRLRSRAPRLPIVCVSIYPPTSEVVALEPVAYLLKPFSLSALQTAIAKAVERSSILA